MEHGHATWNSIPTSIKIVPAYTVSTFKRHLKSSLTSYTARPPGDCPRLWFMLNAWLCARYKFSFSSSYYYKVENLSFQTNTARHRRGVSVISARGLLQPLRHASLLTYILRCGINRRVTLLVLGQVTHERGSRALAMQVRVVIVVTIHRVWKVNRLFHLLTTATMLSVRIFTILILLTLTWITSSVAQNTIAELIRQRSELSMVSKRRQFTCLPVLVGLHGCGDRRLSYRSGCLIHNGIKY